MVIMVTFFFGWQSDVDINSDVSLRSISPITRSIMLMPGWQNYINPADLPSKIVCPQTNNTCILQHTESLSPDSSDIAVFHESGLSQSPPFKRKGQLWVFRTGESQQSLTADHMEFWDGYFNYSIDHREGATMQTYVTTPRKLDTPTKRDFAKEKLALLKQTKMHSDALWLVSNCNTDGVYKVGSGRAEYASELSQWINITAYTGNSLGRICATNKFIKPLLKERTNGEEKPMSQFLFYLSFENTLCSNYITEKLWKVLLSSDLTIPVVMGGRAMRDYKSIAPPNSYIDVRNFTSPKRLADHLNYVATDAAAFNYYHQWRNELTFTPPPSTGESCVTFHFIVFHNLLL